MIRVLIADPSEEFSEALRKILGEGWGFEVVACAKTGGELHGLLEKKPDLLFLDMFLPPTDAFHVMDQLMARSPIPVVMTCAAHCPQDSDLFQEALNRGALLVIPKPPNLAVARLRLERLRETLTQMAGISKGQLAADYKFQKSKAAVQRASGPARKVIALVGSTGAVEVLRQLVSRLPAKLKAGVLVAQHMHASVWNSFHDRLRRTAALKSAIARGGEIVREGDVLLSPVDSTLLLSLASCGGIARLEKVGYLPGQIPLQPHMDAFLASMSCFGRDALAVILSGIGRSGVLGARAIREAGGEVWVQDPRTALVGSMPAAVEESGLASRVLEVEAISAEFARIFS